MKPIKINVNTNNNTYPILIGSGLLDQTSSLLKKNSIDFENCLLIIDKKVPKKFIKKVFKSLSKSKKKIFLFSFNANEKNKNQNTINKILKLLLIQNFHRKDCIISIGGGITGDVAGFAASLFKRGINFVNVPTTLLAQVDSSIGGKTGINSKYGKNLIGSFYQPRIVLTDIEFLKTLPRREIFCGYGEILKHSLISSKKFFTYLDKNASKVLNLRSPFIEKSIYQSCLIKKRIVEIDEKEKGPRMILNFGHTFAHAYEAFFGYSKKLNHGEAVLHGILNASKFCLKINLIKISEFRLIQNHLLKYRLINKFNKKFNNNDIKKFIYFMLKDKKNNNEKINLVLLKKIGKPIFNLKFDKKKLYSFLKNELIN